MEVVATVLTVKLIIHSIAEYTKINGKDVLCNGKICGNGVHKGGGNYLCSHYNLKVKFSKLVREEWDFDKNKKNPEDYTPHSGKKVWWKCKNNVCGCHKWSSRIIDRTRSDNPKGCPFCSSKKLCPHNNFATKYPHLLVEYSKRNPNPPTSYAPHADVIVWWKCKNDPCGCHEWQARINSRTRSTQPTGCPYCEGQICPHNNFAVVSSHDLLIEFDIKRNPKPPQKYAIQSNEKVWWICKINSLHRWQTFIYNRTGQKLTECPFCTASRLNKGYSKIAIKWLRSIEENQNIKIQYMDPDKGIDEYVIPGLGLKVDGYCHETKTVYQFHGNFWHGNPEFFDPEDINPKVGISFGRLYEETIEKENKIKQMGYNLVVKWESDL